MPRRHTIAFATSREYASLTPDDRLALEPLAALGIDVVPAVWNDRAVDWSAFDLVVVRSTWDYFRHPDAFARWVARLEAERIPTLNATAMLAWNMDKRYLRALAAREVRIPETVWLDAGARVDLDALLVEHHWAAAVVKPVVSAGAFQTLRVSVADAAQWQPALDGALARGHVMVQPFLTPVVEDGEWSLLFFNGTFSHAVRKWPAEGDFRVQHQHGGRAEPAAAPEWLVAAGLRVLDAACAELPALGETMPLYARVDGVVVQASDAADGPAEPEFVLMELEALEPSLFLAIDPAAPERFARAVADALLRAEALAEPRVATGDQVSHA